METGRAYIGRRVIMRDGESRDKDGAEFFSGAGQVIGFADAGTERPLTVVMWDDGQRTTTLETRVVTAPPPTQGTFDAVFIPYIGQVVPAGAGKARPLTNSAPDDVIIFENIHPETGDKYEIRYELWRPGAQPGVWEYLVDQNEHPISW